MHMRFVSYCCCHWAVQLVIRSCSKTPLQPSPPFSQLSCVRLCLARFVGQYAVTRFSLYYHQLKKNQKTLNQFQHREKKQSDNELHQNIRQRRSHRLSIRLSTTVCLSVCRCVSPCLPVHNSEQTLITQKVAKQKT